MFNKWLKKREKRKAFTLIEVLAALVILALVLGVAGPAVFKQIQKGRIKTATIQISALEQSMTAFNLDCGFFPDTEPGLNALIEPPSSGKGCKDYDPDGYLKKGKVPQVPWGEDYVYVSPGQNNKSSYDLYSKGPDKAEGTDDDITNW
jgi:general secretion pathway protein G